MKHVGQRPEWQPHEIGTNPLTALTDDEFIESLKAFRTAPIHHNLPELEASWAMKYLNEAERRFMP